MLLQGLVHLGSLALQLVLILGLLRFKPKIQSHEQPFSRRGALVKLTQRTMQYLEGQVTIPHQRRHALPPGLEVRRGLGIRVVIRPRQPVPDRTWDPQALPQG